MKRYVCIPSKIISTIMKYSILALHLISVHILYPLQLPKHSTRISKVISQYTSLCLGSFTGFCHDMEMIPLHNSIQVQTHVL